MLRPCDLLHDRMPPFFDLDPALRIDLRAYVAVFIRHKRQGYKGIQHGDGRGRFFDAQHLGSDLFTDLTEQCIFQRSKPLFRAEDRILHLLQLRRDKAFRIGQGLFPDIAVWHLGQKAVGDLDIIAEDLVVAHPEIFDPGGFPLLFRQFGQPLFAVGPCVAQLIHLGMVPLPDQPALPERDRRLLGDGSPDQSRKIRKYIQIGIEILQYAGFQRRKHRLDTGQHGQGRMKCQKISGIGVLGCDPGHEPFQVIDRRQVFPQFFSCYIIIF